MARKSSRRSFLKTSAVAASAAAFGVPNILSARAPNSKLGVAVIGCGGQGGGNPGLAAKEHLVALCDVDDKIIDKTIEGLVAAKMKEPPLYFDYRTMFDKHAKELDAVFIA